MSARYEFWLSGPVPEVSQIGPQLLAAPLPPEDMLKRLVLALRGAGYTVRSYAYDCITDQVQVAEPVSHPVSTVEVTAAEQPQGETDE